MLLGNEQAGEGERKDSDHFQGGKDKTGIEGKLHGAIVGMRLPSGMAITLVPPSVIGAKNRP